MDQWWAAQTGMTVNSGDQVRTGPASSAIVAFTDGGLFQLDQNTDPIFSWAVFGQIRCIVVDLLEGQGAGNGEICIRTASLAVEAGSEVNIWATPRQAVLTLLRGRLTVTWPQRMALLPGQEVTANAGSSAVAVRNLSPAELPQRVAWRGRYAFNWPAPSYQAAPPPPLPRCPEGRVYDPRSRSCVPVSTPAPPPHCPEGQVYDPRSRSCVPVSTPAPPPRCPEGQVYDPGSRSCVPVSTPAPPPRCPEGQVYDPRSRSCVPVSTPAPPPHCPEGQVYDPRSRSCVPITQQPSTVCPAGQVYDPRTGHCVYNIR